MDCEGEVVNKMTEERRRRGFRSECCGLTLQKELVLGGMEESGRGRVEVGVG